MTKKTKDVVVATPGNKALTTPMKPNLGNENADPSDLIIPVATLCQPLSPRVVGGERSAGEIINSLSGEIMPETFTPVFHYKEAVKFVEGDEQGVEWSTRDKSDPRFKSSSTYGFYTNSAGKKIFTGQLFLCWYGFFGDNLKKPVLIRFTKSSYNAGRLLLTDSTDEDAPIFRKAYRITSEKVSKGKYTWYQFVVTPGAETDPKDLSGLAEAHGSFERSYGQAAEPEIPTEAGVVDTDSVPF